MKKDKKRKNSSDWHSAELKKQIYDDNYRQLHVLDTSSKNKLLFQKLKDQGIEANTGSWSPSEVKQLEDNLKLYQNTNPNIDVFKVFYHRESGDNRIVLKNSHFWDILSYNLCRSYTNVQSHFRYLCQERAGYKTGGFSQNERKYLKELVVKYGRDWPVISKLMNRSETSLSIVYTSHIINDINRGPWNNEEKERFLFITKKLMKYNHDNNLPLFKISWRTISDFVLSRSYHSCQYFGTKNKQFIEKIFFDTYFASTKRNAMIIYVYFSSVKSKKDIDWKELFVLYNGQFDEVFLKNQFTKIMSEVSNVEFKGALKGFYENEIMDLKVLYKRINFENIMQYSMTKPRAVGYLKAKYYLLVHENIPNFMEKTSEEVIDILHTKYCSNKSTKTSSDTTTPSHTDYPKKSTHHEIIDLIDVSSDDEDKFIDLTLIPDDDDLSDNVDDSDSDENINLDE